MDERSQLLTGMGQEALPDCCGADLPQLSGRTVVVPQLLRQTSLSHQSTSFNLSAAFLKAYA
jgi:hypothetical protein